MPEKPNSTIILHREIARKRREKIAEQINRERVGHLRSQKTSSSPTPPPKTKHVKTAKSAPSSTPTAVSVLKPATPSASAATSTAHKTPHTATSISIKEHTDTPLKEIKKQAISRAIANTSTKKTSLYVKTTPSSSKGNRFFTKNTLVKASSRALVSNSTNTSVSNLSKLPPNRPSSTPLSEAISVSSNKSATAKSKKGFLKNRRSVLALACSLAAVVTMAFAINSSLPDIPARVAAIQAGFNVKYPAYVPQGYGLSSITSDKNSKVTIRLTNGEHRILIFEERSTWDSQSLLNNYVKKNWKNNYITTRDQGLTIYLSGNNAVWVNGGVLYRIEGGNDIDRLRLYNIIYSL